MALGHNVGERTPWMIRDGLLECRDDETILEVRGPVNAPMLILWCWKCQREYRLLPFEVERLARCLTDTRKCAQIYD